MSAYISLAPIIERAAAENALTTPAAQFDEPMKFRRTRSLAAGLLRGAARRQLRVAARLDRPVRHRLATA